MDWFSNDELFLRELAVGHRHAELVAAALRQEGLAVTVTPMEIREDVCDRERFSDEFDLLVGQRAPCVIDVKSRDLAFGASGYPYPSAFVDTVSGWNAKVTKPMAIVLISQQTREMQVVSVRRQAAWWIESRFDRRRQIDESFYMERADQLRPFAELVAWLRAREELPAFRAEPR